MNHSVSNYLVSATSHLSASDGKSPNQQRGQVAKVQWWRPGVTLVIFGLFTLGMAEVIREDEWALQGAFTIACGAILLPAIWQALQREIHQVLADHLLILAIAFITYFVVGALLIPFGPRDQADAALSYYWVDAQLGLKVTAVNCIGIGIALTFSSLINFEWIAKVARATVNVGRDIPPMIVISAFVIIGGGASFYVWLFDINPSAYPVSGAWRALAKFLLVAIMIAAAHHSRGGR